MLDFGPCPQPRARGWCFGMLPSFEPTAFVGRDAELALLLRLSEDARNGEGRIVLLSGEAGIGKSRLVRELISRVHAEGLLTATALVHEDASEAFGVAGDLLRLANRRVGGEAGELLTRAHASLVAPHDEAAESSPATRRLLFDAVAEALGSAARCTPPLALAVLEDVHWGDRSSLQLVMHLARRIGEHPLLLLCTLRPEHGTDPALAEVLDVVRQEQLGPRLNLLGLADDDATAIVHSAAGSEITGDELERIIRRADGNPLFLEELTRSGVRSLGAAAVHGVPDGIRHLIQRRSLSFSQPAREVSAVAAVLGDNSRLSSICELWGGSLDDAASAIDELAAAGVLEATDSTVRFRHALIRDAIYAAIPFSERRRLHLAASASLERDFGPRSAALIAAHLEAAGSDDDARRAVDWRLAAAEHALGVMAFEDALEQLRGAEAVMDRAGGTDEQRIGCALLGGEAARQVGMLDDSLERFVAAGALAANIGDGALEARAALGYELAFLATGKPRSGPGAHSLGLLDRALSHLNQQPETAGLRARLLAALAQARFFSGEGGEAARLSAAALATARESGDKGAEAAALEARRIATWRPENVEERTSLTREIVTLGEAAGERELILEGLYWQSTCLFEAGESHEARSAVQHFASLADTSHQPRRAAEASRMLAMIALLDGDLTRARRFAEQSLSDAERAGSVDARVHYTTQMVEILRDGDELVPFVHSITSDHGLWLASHPRRVMLSTLFAMAGEVQEAARLIEGLMSRRFEELERDWMWLPLMFLVSEAVAIVGNPAWAAMLHAQLVPYSGRLVVNSNSVCYGSVEFALGRLAQTAGWPSAAGHFAAAAERNERAGVRLWADRARRALGPLASTQPGGPAQLPAGLTSREAEVLSLIAAGQSNQDIAEQLVLSVRTVERHITNLYGKIDARGRADATAFALRHGLLP